MSGKKTTKYDSIRGEDEILQPHRVLREVLKHYLEFRDIVTSPEQQATGQAGRSRTIGNTRGTDGVIEYVYPVATADGIEKIEITVSFWDLQGILNKLSPRKREAVFYNVILDKKQKDVAEIMGITTVSVGQYVEQGMLQLSEDYFNVIEVKSSNEPASNGRVATNRD